MDEKTHITTLNRVIITEFKNADRYFIAVKAFIVSILKVSGIVLGSMTISDRLLNDSASQ